MCAYVINCRPAAPDCVAAALELVESRIEAAVVSEVSVASGVAHHLMKAGGKRVRPALVLMAAGACGGDVQDSRVIDLAAVAELFHTASLVHDDVVDQTHERRGVPTANGKWGNKLSVLGGDFLLARAFSLLAGIGVPEVTNVLSVSAVEMTESEVLQAECEGSVKAWREYYWRIIGGKTAAFMGACCRCGAIIAGAGEPWKDALRDYGVNFGLAFQITDDLLDLAGDPSETGKDIGSDLVHGKFTLPVLIALDHGSCDQEAQRRLTHLADSGFLTPEEACEAATIVIGSGAAESAQATALDRADKASRCLSSLPDTNFRSALASYALSIARRVS